QKKASAPLSPAETAGQARDDRESSPWASCRFHFFFSLVTLPLQQIHFVRQHRFAVAEKRDDDSEPHGSLRSRISNDEQRKDLPGHITVQTGKCHQVDVHGIQNQLDGHEHNDDVASGDHTEHADDEERETQEQVMSYRKHHWVTSFSWPLPRRQSWPPATGPTQFQMAVDTSRTSFLPPLRNWPANAPRPPPSTPATPARAFFWKTRTSGRPGQPRPTRPGAPPTSDARTGSSAGPRPNYPACPRK